VGFETSPLAEQPVHGTTWQGQLEDALTIDEVLWVVREFLDSLQYFEIQMLPAPCRPKERFVSAEELASYAYELTLHTFVPHAPSQALVERLSTFFGAASTRCAQIAGRDRSQRDAARESL
jgi:hypothetical protein